MKTPTELITAYEAGERVPGGTLVRASDLLKHIQQALSGQEWDSDTCNVIAGLVAAEGYEIKDVPTEDEGGLTPEQLQEKYASEDSWDEHPDFRRCEWRQQVCSRTTQRGYWDWVASQVEQGAV